MNGSAKVSGFLLRGRKRFTLDSVAPGLDLSVRYRVTSRSRHYQAGCGRLHLNKSREEISANPIRSTAGLGQDHKPSPLIWKKGNSAPATLGTAFPQQKSELHSGNVACYKLLSRNRRGLHNRGKRAVIMTDSRWIKDNDWNLFGTLRLPLL